MKFTIWEQLVFFYHLLVGKYDAPSGFESLKLIMQDIKYIESKKNKNLEAYR